MSECMQFPDTWEEFEQAYGFEDKKEIYTNGSRLIQSFRVKQWLDHTAEPEREIIHCKDCKFYTPMNRKLKTGICAMTMHHLGDDGFCSDAEKRGE